MVTLFLVFWGTSVLSSLVAAPIYILTNSVGGFLYDHFIYLFRSFLLEVWVCNSRFSDFLSALLKILFHCFLASVVVEKFADSFVWSFVDLCVVFTTIYLGIDFFIYPAWDTLYFMLINSYLFKYHLWPIFSILLFLGIWWDSSKTILFFFPYILTPCSYFSSFCVVFLASSVTILFYSLLCIIWYFTQTLIFFKQLFFSIIEAITNMPGHLKYFLTSYFYDSNLYFFMCYTNCMMVYIW